MTVSGSTAILLPVDWQLAVGRCVSEHRSDLVVLVARQATAYPSHLVDRLWRLARERQERLDGRTNLIERARLQLAVLRRDAVRVALQALATTVDGPVPQTRFERGARTVASREVRAEHEDLH